MEHLSEKNPDRLKSQFSSYIAKGINAGDLEALYSKVHAAIRAKPDFVKKPKKVLTKEEKKKAQKKHRLSYAQRKDKIRQKKDAHAKKQAKAQE